MCKLILKFASLSACFKLLHKHISSNSKGKFKKDFAISDPNRNFSAKFS